MPYEAKNASHLLDQMYRDADGCWYGIYKGILGFMVNTEELQRLDLEAPQDWDDLLKPEYKGLIWLSNPNTAGTAKLVINTMVQMKGHDEAMKYFVDLDKNIAQYTKSGSGPSKKVGIGECVIGIGFLHDGITQILDGYDNISAGDPQSGTSFEIGATAIFQGREAPERRQAVDRVRPEPRLRQHGQGQRELSVPGDRQRRAAQGSGRIRSGSRQRHRL